MKHKFQFLATILFIFPVQSFFPQVCNKQWSEYRAGSISADNYTRCSFRDAIGNTYLAGDENATDAFIVKMDNQGTPVMNIPYNNPLNGQEETSVIKVDNAGNIYLAGDVAIGGGRRAFVVKFSPTGVKQWEYMVAGVITNSYVHAMCFDNANSPNSIYVAGSLNDSIFISKINLSGIELWRKKTQGGSLADVTTDMNGNPYVCGSIIIGSNNTDWVTAQLTTNGNIQWQHTVSGLLNANDDAVRILVNASGVASVYGTILDSANSNSGVGVARYSSTGTLQWIKRYYIPNLKYHHAVDFTADNVNSNFYLTGKAYNNGPDEIFTIKVLASNGSVVWTKNLNNTGYTYSYVSAIKVDNAGNAYISGYSYTLQADIFLAKYASATGNQVFLTDYDNPVNGGGATDVSVSLYLDNTNHPYITGFTNANNYSQTDALLLRFNTNGSLDWQSTYDDIISGNDYALSSGLDVDLSGNSFIAGTVQNSITNVDALVAKYDAKGNLKWSATFDDANAYNPALGFSQDSSNNSYLSTYDANSNIILLKYDSTGTLQFNRSVILPGSTPVQCTDKSGNTVFACGKINTSDFFITSVSTSGVQGPSNTQSSTVSNTSANYIEKNNSGQAVIGGYIQAGSANHILIQNYNYAGTKNWEQIIMGYDSTKFIQCVKVVKDPNSNAVFLVGQVRKKNDTLASVLVIKLDWTTGVIAWQKTYNANDAENMTPVNMDVSSAGVFVTGTYHDAGSQALKVFTQKWDLNTGSVTWTSNYTGHLNLGSTGVSGISADNSGNVFIAAQTNTTSSGLDVVLVKYDGNGTLVYETLYDGGNNATDNSAAVYTNKGRTYVLATTTTINSWSGDISIIKYCDLVQPTIVTAGGTNLCPNSSISLQATSPSPYNYTWSPGNINSPVLNVTTAGNYFVTGSFSDGCSVNSNTVNITYIPAPVTPAICMVTVDDSSTHNIIYWDKTPYANSKVIGFKIYREDLTNVYTYIGAVPFTNLSAYHDHDAMANPNTTTKRYKISAVDSCGTESTLGNYHNTIYIVSNGNGQYTWNPLYTIENGPNPVNNYVLMRDNYNNGNFQQVAITAGTQNTIVDPAFATWQPTASWRVETIWGISCTPTARQANGTLSAVVRSKSNITNNRTTSINYFQSSFSLYPNPTNGNLTLHLVNTAQEKVTIKITSVLGEDVYNEIVAQAKDTYTMDLSGLESGTYIVQVTTNNNTCIKRIVKN